MRCITRTAALVIVAAVLLPVAPAQGHHRPAHFRDVYCSSGAVRYPGDTNRISRSDARSYAAVAVGDGYQWGGGCWNGNGVDDQPGDPPGDPNTGGEGGDCSGFVFKTWRLLTDRTQMGFRQWGILHYIHGPYSSTMFKNGEGAPIQTATKVSATTMDAFARHGHIGMIWQPFATPDGQDLIVEAKSEADGTGVWARAYRSSSSYSGVARRDWAPPPDFDCGEYECFPGVITH